MENPYTDAEVAATDDAAPDESGGGAPALVPGASCSLGMDCLAERARTLGERRYVTTGEVVVRQGEARSGLYVIASGAMEVMVPTPDGSRVLVARLGPGSHFGEMSLLTGAPVSADVVAAEPSVIHALSAEQYEDILREDRELLECLTTELAARLRRTNDQLALQQQRQADLGRLVGSRAPRLLLEGLPGVTKALEEQVRAAAAADLPLLIVGEAGVGKRTLARHIAATGPAHSRTVLVVDCSELPPDEARSQLFGDADPASVTRFGDHIGFLQAADGGTLILAGVQELPREVQDDVAVFLNTGHRASASAGVTVRLIATAGGAAEDATASEALVPALAAALGEGLRIELRPLRQRRRDILPLAEFLLERIARRSGEAMCALDETARRELAGYDFSFGNIRELDDVLRLAVALSEGRVIGAQHLFFGPASAEAGAQVDLLKIRPLQWAALRRTVLVALRVMVGLVFAAIAAACLLAPETVLGRGANLLVWGLWWPLLVVSVLVLGRLWCAVCPLSSGAEAAQTVTRLGRADPARLQRLGPPLALLGFVAIMWAEQVSDMTSHPAYTGVLLIALATAALVTGQLYQRHAWCRYLCPLGAMGAALSVCSSLRVRAQKEVCAASCTGHECYKGSAAAPGCPMFSHALFLSSGQHCKLCMQCLRSCPSHSPRLVLQLPLCDIWRSDMLNVEMAPLTVAVALMALLMAAGHAWHRAGTPHDWWVTGVSLGAVAIGWVFWRALVGRRGSERGGSVTWSARVMFAYAPLVGGLLFACHLGAIGWLGAVMLTAAAPGGGGVSVSALWVVQALAGATGLLFTAVALAKVARARTITAARAAPLAVALSGLAAAYLVAGLWLLR